METRLQGRKYLAARNWAAMDTDILCSIFTRLSYVDLLCVNSTCWDWNSAINLFKSCSATSSFQEMPWLIFSPHEKDEVATEGEKNGRFMNVGKKIYPFNDLAAEKMSDGCYCIGSSHDWLVCLDKQAIPYLLNPFTSHRIELPHLDSSLGVERIYGIGKQCTINTVDGEYWNRFKRSHFVIKAVLSSSPSLDNNYYLVILCRMGKSFAFCKDGDSLWTKLDSDRGENCSDFIFHENQLYGFYSDETKPSYFKVWAMNQDGFNLVKKIDILDEELDYGLQDSGFSWEQFYLVESQGSLLVVKRVPVYRGEIDYFETDCNSETHSLEIQNQQFNIFKLDMEQKLWKGVESLGGFAFFLGRNQSISADVRNYKIFQEDSVYFTDDIVHLSGVFSLKDSCVDWTDWLDGTKREKQRSTPTWVVPRLK